MKAENEYRSELKYIISDNDFQILKNRLDCILKKDKNAKGNSYKIASIYFDNMYKTSYYQVLNGVSERWKYRIRFYNNNNKYIILEKKYKVNSMTRKTSTRLTMDEYEKIMNGKIIIKIENSKLLNEFIVKMKTELLKPIVIIEYERVPYIYEIGNVRITLDYNIGYTYDFKNSFNNYKKLSYLKEKVLEIKYNKFVPDYIIHLLELNHLSYTSFSKFKNCIEGNIGDSYDFIRN